MRLQVGRGELPDWVLATFLTNCMQDTAASQVGGVWVAINVGSYVVVADHQIVLLYVLLPLAVEIVLRQAARL
jgi:hypothetical protein